MATVRFRSLEEYNLTVEALRQACDQHRDSQGRLGLDRTLMLTNIVTARRRRTPGSGVAIDLNDEQVELARATLSGHTGRSVFYR